MTEGLSDRVLDIFRVRQYFGVVSAVRELMEAADADRHFAGTVRRALAPLPGDRWEHPGRIFAGARSPAATALKGRRVAVVASGGSGATAAVIGVVRALQEGGVQPALMSLCSGSAFFGLALAAGRSPEHVARFVAGLEPSDYLDPDWGAVARLLPRGGRGFGGLVRGDRVEHTFHRLVGDMTMADLAIPAYAPIWNVETNHLDFIGPRTHPRFPLARAIRMSIAIPLFIEPVRMEGGSWCDGGIVDILPVAPVLDFGERYDTAVVINSFYPHEFAGESEQGWRTRPWSVLRIADQVKSNQHVQLAREHLARLRAEVEEVLVIDPVPYSRVRGARFYSQFIDPRPWPGNMRAGRSAMLAALRTRKPGLATGRPAAPVDGRRRRNAAAPAPRPATPTGLPAG